jgi:hypothetical protein
MVGVVGVGEKTKLGYEYMEMEMEKVTKYPPLIHEEKLRAH